ncbi:NlpC/P60 family protein [Streptomyces sp. NPDC050703]|uniref:NlpC/P60 family protein n=1 Tax=Streptomyces sp. NPDC050703 TaxID=3157218 RepID=UPI003449461F
MHAVTSSGTPARFREPARALTTVVVPGSPEQLQVFDDHGLLATLTKGAKTVPVRGQTRSFTERKRAFTDNFVRTVSGGWGQSPAGGTWLNLLGSDANFYVDGSQGFIVNDVANVGRYASLNDDNVADVDVSCKLTVDKVSAGAATSVALAVSYADSSTHYRARLLFNTTGTVQLVLERAAGSTTTLGAATTVGTGFVASQWWRVRIQRLGATVSCRAWLDGTPEPSTWLHTATDPTPIGPGRIGIRSFASSGSTAVPFHTVVDDVDVPLATWASPPVVTHDTWVRVLDAPFSGTWTDALADQVRAWAVDTRPDALAYAFMYVTGAPDVTDAEFAGKRVFGEAGYGPLKADGTRTEFSDWNDFIGVPWVFPNGETRNFPHGDVTISGCLDCSGFVRTVYGRHMGIPLVFDRDFDGINLPRRTRDIGPSGPGVAIQMTLDTVPPLTGIQIGDVVLFDADNTEAANQIDHNGIYLGLDTAGHPRFISSRKVVNGPTMSDMGGNSTLDGTGTYATRLRIIRRF